MRVLIDECLPRRVATDLRAAGHDVVDVKDTDLRGKSDADVFARAIDEHRVIVTGDMDFANAVRFPPGTHSGIVVLRITGAWTVSERAERLHAALDDLGDPQGTIVIVEATQTRIFGRRG